MYTLHPRPITHLLSKFRIQSQPNNQHIQELKEKKITTFDSKVAKIHQEIRQVGEADRELLSSSEADMLVVLAGFWSFRHGLKCKDKYGQ